MATSRKRNIEIDVVVDDKQARAALRGVGDESTKTGKRFSDAAKLFAVGAGAAIAAFAQDSIRAFSELEQSIGGTEAVFGDASDAVDAFAETSAQSIGLAESEFRSATTLIGGQLKRMTGDVDFAAEQSVELTRVAADLAATYGGTTAEAVQALGSAFRGEADPAERFNLNLKVSAVNAKAVELGLAKSTTEVDDNARAQATLALITEQSADAQGQFSREVDTVAGQTQIATARLEELKAQMGEQLAPAVVEGTERVSNLFDALDEDVNLGWSQRLSAAMQTFLGESTESVAAYIAQKDAANDAADGTDNLTAATGDFAVATRKGRGASREFAEQTKDTADNLDEQEDATDRAAAALDRFQDRVRGQIDPLFALADAVANVGEAQRDTKAAADEYGEGSPEHQEALRKEAEAWLDVKTAQLRVAEQSGLTKEQFETHLLNMTGLTKEQVALILAEFEKINAFKFTVPTIRGRDVAAGGANADRTYRGGRASGGRVGSSDVVTVGEDGPELFAPDTSGTVIPNHQLSGTTIHVHGSVITERELVELIRKLDRRWLP